jgi:guanylate kinase
MNLKHKATIIKALSDRITSLEAIISTTTSKPSRDTFNQLAKETREALTAIKEA